MCDRRSLTARIRAEALRLGFFKLGIAPAGPLPWEDHFGDWLAKGMQGGMKYMERQAEKRKNVALILEDVRSILVLGVNYFSDRAHSSERHMGKISCYAWGDDYHALMLSRLNRLLDLTRAAEPKARGLCYVDAGPVMEKVWGAHTTLGWMGKHSNLISREQGSWFFIGVILLNIELEYDTRERDFCGSCTLCLHACPTGAIVAPYVVDARLCVSYLTIEWKGVIPVPLRPLIGNRIFGCDDCQEVCPWNRFAKPSPESAFWPSRGNLVPDLIYLSGISNKEFEARFSGSSVRRARRDAFVRNVVVALGNSGRFNVIPALAKALRDSSPLVRGHAAWALGEVQGSVFSPQASGGDLPSWEPEVRTTLENALRDESDPWVRMEITLAIGRLQTLDLRPRT